MDYGQPITRSISILWRHPYLWLLALLGGADVGAGGGFPGFSGNFGTPSGAPPASTTAPGPGAPASPTPADLGQQVSSFVQDNLAWILAVVALVLLVALAWLLLSCITTGALVRGSAEHDAGRPFRLGMAWRAGLGSFRSILALRLLGILLGLAVLVLTGALVLAAVLAFANGQTGLGVAVVAAGVLVLLAVLVASVAVGIVFILATRAVVLEQLGALRALGRGLRLMRARLGRVLLVWLIQVAVGLAAAIAAVIGLLVAAVPVVAVLVGGGLAAGPGAVVPLAILGALLFAIGVLALAGVTGAYFSTYWTLAFRRLELG